MSFVSMTDTAIADEMGRRLNGLRLRSNLSQQEVATSTGLSLKAVQTAEKGGSKLLTYIKILRALNALDSLESFLPDHWISPLQLMKLKGKKRQRASGSRKNKNGY